MDLSLADDFLAHGAFLDTTDKVARNAKVHISFKQSAPHFFKCRFDIAFSEFAVAPQLSQRSPR